MRAAVPVQGLHLDEDDRDAKGAPLGMVVNNLGRRAKGGDEDEPADILSVAVPLDNASGRFCIFGTAEQLYAFAAELVGAVASHLDVEHPEHAEALGTAFTQADGAVNSPLGETL